MSSEENQRPNVLGVATSGIQDVSALLPLLGTEQCERLVTSALGDGLLYAAATPMSIFGSLGIVKAGFVVLVSSIDYRWFPGPSLLRNAGFASSGVGALLVPIANTNRGMYIAEDKLCRHLSKIRVVKVEVNAFSKDLILWNLRLITATAFLSICGFAPYIYTIVYLLPNDPFRKTWLYPLLRIIGCNITVVGIQFVFQLRVLEEAYCRIRFLATDSYLKDVCQSLPPFWDPTNRSKMVLGKLQHYLSSNSNPNAGANPNSGSSSGGAPRSKSLATFRSWIREARMRIAIRSRHGVPPERVSITGATRRNISRGLGRLTPFTFHFPKCDSRKADHPPAHLLRGSPDAIDMERADAGSGEVTSPNPPLQLIAPMTILLGMSQVFLLVGIRSSVVGYLGCFSVVQSSPENSQGPLVWLVIEAALAVLRTLVWAWNPSWDDPRSFVALRRASTTNEESYSIPPNPSPDNTLYGIGWTLDSTSGNQVHALIIGIDSECPGGSTVEPVKRSANAQQVANCLQESLAVPHHQVVTLTNSAATKAGILNELKKLGSRSSVAAGAPIIIYFATESTTLNRDPPGPCLVTYSVETRSGSGTASGVEEMTRSSDFEKQRYLAYTEIVDVLRRIAEEKTRNITLVIDPSEDMFTRTVSTPEGPFSYNDILEGDPSHILLCRAGNGAEGSLTQELLKALVPQTPDKMLSLADSLRGASSSSEELRAMTYQALVDKVNVNLGWDCQGAEQRVFCTTTYQHRLLFDGLLSRKLSNDHSSPVLTIHYTDI